MVCILHKRREEKPEIAAFKITQKTNYRNHRFDINIYKNYNFQLVNHYN